MDNEVEQVEISPEVVAVSEKVRDALVVDEDRKELNKIYYKTEKDIYKECLPEGLTMKQVRAVEEHNANYVAGVAKAVGAAYQEALDKNKNLKEAVAKVKACGRNYVDVRIETSRLFPGTLSKDGEKIEKVAYTTIAHNTVADRKNSGDLKAVLDELRESTEEMLGKNK